MITTSKGSISKKERIYQYLKKNNDCCYVNEIYLMIEPEHFLPSKQATFRIKCIFLVSVFLSGILLAANMIFKNKYVDDNKIAIARVERERSKIKRVCGDDVQMIKDDITNGDFTMYRIGDRRYRFLFLVKRYIKMCFTDYERIKKLSENEDIEPYASEILLIYAKRIPHTVVYKNSMEYIMKSNNLSTAYIGDTCARYAMICEALSKEYNRKLICIPHGVETTEKLPAGLAGNLFYCPSPEMALKLNNIYSTSKFIFDEEIIRQMCHIKRKGCKNKEKRKVVFFSQPLEIEASKKVIQKIAEWLDTKDEKLYIKVHPLETPTGYQQKNVEIIDDFTEAIIGNLCISFSSTILIEALYNNSCSVSIIHLVHSGIELNGMHDFLNDSRIIKPKNLESLKSVIDNFITRNGGQWFESVH